MSTFDLQLNAAPLRPSFDNEAQKQALPTRLFQSLSQRLAEWKLRRRLARLLDRDDATLDDMGMPRRDLLAALDLPLSVDAACALSQWRAERRITG